MKTGIIAYLLVGLVLCIIGPLADGLREAVGETRLRTKSDRLSEKKSKPEWSGIAFVVTIHVLGLIAYPFLYSLILFDRLRSRSVTGHGGSQSVPKVREEGLYFYRISGHGALTCRVCGYNQELTAFIHGRDNWRKEGIQCQGCHALYAIESDERESLDFACHCGGELSRNEPICCPVCKSRLLEYRMKYMT